jgi:transmembrane 9 superfamily protein 3
LLLLTLCPARSVMPSVSGTLFVERGTIVTVFIICYALTSFVGG